MHSVSESIPQDITFIVNPQKLSETSQVFLQITTKLNFLLKAGKFSEACLILEEISQSSHANPEIFTKLGHLYYKLRQYNEAETCYYKVINSNYTEYQAQSWFGLGQIYYQQKNYIKCISGFINCLNINPEFEYSSLCYLKLGFCQHFIKEYGLAETYIEKSL